MVPFYIHVLLFIIIIIIDLDSTHEWKIRRLAFWACIIILLKMMISSSIHLPANEKISFFMNK
jgi:hypothetical protein